jgi:hypothetical protein
MKRILTIFALLVLGVLIIYFGTFLIQNSTLKRSISQDYGDNIVFDGKIRDFIRCNMNILKPEFAYTYKIGETADVDFYNSINLFSQTEEEWDNSYTGGTTVKNVTFPELVAMVKEDCEQFKRGYLDYTGYEDLSEEEKREKYYEIERKNLGWTYTPAPKKTEEMTEEEIENKANTILSYDLGSEVYLESFIKNYGDIHEMTPLEVVELYERIREEGLNEEVEREKKLNDIYGNLEMLSESQYRQLKERYGDYKGLSEDELIEWNDRIVNDMINGDFEYTEE